MKRTILILVTAIIGLTAIPFQEISAANYDPQEIKQLVTFLNLQSGEAGKTNAQALSIEAKVTEANVSEWADKIINKTDGDKIVWIRISGLNRNVRFGGSFRIENFSKLKWITLESVSIGNEVKVANCPELGEFLLNTSSSNDDNKNSYPTQRLEITNCPKLYDLQVLAPVTEFVLSGCNELVHVTFSKTNMPSIDFSTQTKLQRLILNNNAFSKIGSPDVKSLECQNNRIEPADLVNLIKKTYGNSRPLDWTFLPFEYKPQSIKDTVYVGTTIDLRKKASFKYGNPEKDYTGTFKWQYEKIESWGGKTLVDITNTAEMTKGIYTVPAEMAGKTLVATYLCEPMITANSEIRYYITVKSKGQTHDIVLPEKKDSIKDNPEKKYYLSVVPNNSAFGSVSGSGSYKEKTNVTLTANSKEGAKFVHWKEENGRVFSENKYVMPAKNVIIVGVFEEQEKTKDTTKKPPTPLQPPPPPTTQNPPIKDTIDIENICLKENKYFGCFPNVSGLGVFCTLSNIGNPTEKVKKIWRRWQLSNSLLEDVPEETALQRLERFIKRDLTIRQAELDRIVGNILPISFGKNINPDKMFFRIDSVKIAVCEGKLSVNKSIGKSAGADFHITVKKDFVLEDIPSLDGVQFGEYVGNNYGFFVKYVTTDGTPLKISTIIPNDVFNIQWSRYNAPKSFKKGTSVSTAGGVDRIDVERNPKLWEDFDHIEIITKEEYFKLYEQNPQLFVF